MIERYSLPEMSAIWSDESRLDLWVRIEVEAVKAWAELGKVPADAAGRIERMASATTERVRQIEAETHHDVIAFLKALGETTGEDTRFIHLGMTSSDVLDTATGAQIDRAGRLILETLDDLCDAVRSLALEHRRTPIVGRTHGVHAEPMSLGLKLAYWWDELMRAGDAIAVAVGGAAVGKVSGAVGTFANVDPLVELRVCEALGLRPARISNQVVSRDRHARYLSSLAVLGSIIARQALDIRLLARTETSEILEGFTEKQKGSSAMPHKKNPIKCEQLCGLARLLRGNAHAAMEDIELWQERDISHSSVERVILPDSSIIAHYMAARFAGVVRALDIRPERMLENLESSRGLVYSGTVLTMLVESGMSRDDAYDLVQTSAMESQTTGGSFRDAVLRDKRIVDRLGREGAEAAFDIGRHMSHVDDVFDRLEICEEDQTL